MKSFTLAAGIMMVWAGIVWAEPVAYETSKIHPGSLRFTAESTLHSVHGTAEAFQADPVTFDAETGSIEGPMKVRVLVGQMNTRNGSRDKAMRKMFEADQYPEILWNFKEASCRAAGENRWECSAQGELRIREQAQPLILSLFVTGDGEELDVEGSGVVSLKSFHLKPPSVLGLIRVSDQVKIHFHLLWEPRPG